MTDMPKDPSPEGIPAATVVIFRKARNGGPPELLMVTRSRSMAFAGGAAVFPGGRVDDADFKLADSLGSTLDPVEAAHRVAAIRETLEETGLAIGITGTVDAGRARAARELLKHEAAFAPVLRAMDWTLDLDAVVPFSRWFPKNEKLPRVFDTRFYLADLGTGAVDIEVDATENSKLYWITAQGALDAAESGDLTIIYPTRRNLERLAQFPDFAAAQNDCATYPANIITPFFAERGGRRWLCIPDNLGYPVDGEPVDRVSRG
ncbi:NUDIX hydrolase [Pontixanthobacter sp.]|uniref:NUDIX hydrolase n=1 Tax=Pontixanthobacter sp. TaxID=2792078 RepID=UPI003C7BCC1A